MSTALHVPRDRLLGDLLEVKDIREGAVRTLCELATSASQLQKVQSIRAGEWKTKLAFDYRADVNEPRILYQHTEDDEFELVCESFEAFLSGLVEETEL